MSSSSSVNRTVTFFSEEVFAFYTQIESNKKEIYQINFQDHYISQSDSFETTHTYLKTSHQQQVKFCSDLRAESSFM